MSRNKLAIILSEGKKKLKNAGIAEYNIDANIFMMKATGMDKTKIITNTDYELSYEQIRNFCEMVELRLKKFPSQYIVGKCEFMGNEFFVNKNVLIPRPDTEILVETVIEYNKKYNFKNIIDMCTGSGCIAISLALEGIKNIVASDINSNAIAMAKKNAKHNNILESIKFIESDLFDNICKDLKFDAIVSNPPYIETKEIYNLTDEVKKEPFNALNGGEDGLYFYKKITSQAIDFIKPNGFIFYEIGYNQAKKVSNLLIENGFDDIKIINDYSGHNRVVLGIKRG